MLAAQNPSANVPADLRKLRFENAVMVTRPTLPKLNDYSTSLGQIWERQWLTNEGPFHVELERQLKAYLGVEHLSLFCNATIAMLVALHAQRINDGEVITTPFTFPATTHVLHWNNLTPVFADIEPKTYNMDPSKIERLITSKTRALMPVHVFGNPCDVVAIENIAARHGLQVIYDAAHAFGVRVGDKSILEYGEMSAISFHATKLFSTIEGGALTSRSASQRSRVNSLKNFGIAGEESVIGPGINGKMNEFQAAFGLLQLPLVEDEIAKRRVLTETYRNALHGVKGLTLLEDMPGVTHNYAYFPVLVDPEAFGMNRNALHEALKDFNVFTRKYFYPLCSSFPIYASLPSAAPDRLPTATRVAEQVLCLPIFGTLAPEAVSQIAAIISGLAKR